ncbi:hypothetical protein [Dipodfec virus UOA04_Rod_715]|nr:hypothetical protein [Dipodfec virus UOA04_Rod_715]
MEKYIPYVISFVCLFINIVLCFVRNHSSFRSFRPLLTTLEEIIRVHYIPPVNTGGDVESVPQHEVESVSTDESATSDVASDLASLIDLFNTYVAKTRKY